MKKLCLILVILMSVTMSGCGTTNSSTTSANTAAKVADKVSTADIQFDITKATYSDQNIKINYPQITNLSDSSKQQKINTLIKTSALEVLNDYKDSLSSLSLTMDYAIKYQGADLLNIEYLGLANVQDTAHPVNVIQTTNIDLAKEKQLALSEAVTVNDSFAEKIKAGKYKAYSSDLNLEDAGGLKDVLNGFSSQDLLESFKQQTAKYYFTKDSLGVSLEVAHAVGDHLEMEMEYKTLGGLLLVKPQGSVDLSSGNTAKNSTNSTVTTAKGSSINVEDPQCLLNVNSTLYAGTFDGVCTWDGTTWSQVGSLTGDAAKVSSLTTVNGKLYAGTRGDGVWTWDSSAWSQVGNNSKVNVSSVNSLTVINGTLFEADGEGVWTWDGTSWSQLGSLMGSLKGNGAEVISLTTVNGTLYAGTSANGVWTWAGSAWSQVGSLRGNETTVSSLTAVNGTLYAGTSGDGVWTWDGSTWSQLGSNSTVNAANVSSLITVNGTLYAGTSGDGVWTWNGSAWSQLGSNSTVNAANVSGLTVVNGTLYAGIYQDAVWTWDGTAWHQVRNAAPKS